MTRKRSIIHPALVIVALAICVSAQARLVPVAEGWAKNQINAVIFRKNSVTSFNNSQYVAFYTGDSRVVVAKRELGRTKWQIRQTQFSGDTNDAHNSISIAVDGKGFLHLSWGNHNTKLNYARSIAPGSLEFGSKASMIGRTEDRVTYPEFYSMPNGDMLFFYRDGASGNGNLVLNRYDIKAATWSRIQDNLVDGEQQRNAYPQITVDRKGTIHLSWVWRARRATWLQIMTFATQSRATEGRRGQDRRAKNIRCRSTPQRQNMSGKFRKKAS